MLKHAEYELKSLNKVTEELNPNIVELYA